MKGTIFHIQRFSTHDGPGIRTTIFFKGCNLRCRWCHNPESYRKESEIQYFTEKCIGCGECMTVCSKGIRIEDGQRMGTEHCVLCRACEDVCLSGALRFSGESYTADQLTALAVRDRDYYTESGGGVTLSGGEPLLQSSFAAELLGKLKQEGISTALDTAGNVEISHFEKVLPNTDLILLDLKIMDEELHRKYTGVSNKKILENAKKLLERRCRMHIRIPVIAGVNDTMENAYALKEFLAGYENVEEVRFLSYHNMGLAKAASVGVEMQEFQAPSEERMKEIRSLFGAKGR